MPGLTEGARERTSVTREQQVRHRARLRILHVVPAYYPAVRYGGPIRSVHGLAAALVRRGHEVHVFTTNIDGPTQLDVPVDRAVELDGVAVNYFPVSAILRRLVWAPSLKARLTQSVGQFDVVHLHSVFLWPTWAAARAAAAAHVPYVMAPRGMLVREIIRKKSRLVKELWIQLVERKSLAHAAAVHVTAELERIELQALGLPLPEIACIPNGVDCPAAHAPLSAGPFADLPGRYGLYLGRISWKKGLDRLIESWRYIPDIPLVIAGTDDEGYQATLAALARSVGVAERVKFIGPVSDAHKWAVYENADVFVLPSHSENFGNVVAEAMAMGCPVVVTAEVGIAELVRATGAGIVASGEPKQLAAAINSLLMDVDGRRESGRRGREAVLALLSWDGVASQAETLYRRVMSGTVLENALA
jgi:glycosyltransferase involved in cell wall biosynthesis